MCEGSSGLERSGGVPVSSIDWIADLKLAQEEAKRQTRPLFVDVWDPG